MAGITTFLAMAYILAVNPSMLGDAGMNSPVSYTHLWDGVYHHVEHKNYSSVIAVPSDMYVAGYDSNGVSQLRLWQAKAPGFDMDLSLIHI